MDALTAFIWLFVLGTTLWVVIDASSLGVRRGVIGGNHWADMGVLGWFLVCVLLWIVGFPAYLATRSRYVALRRQYPNGTVPTAEERALRSSGADSYSQYPAPQPTQAVVYPGVVQPVLSAAPVASGPDVVEQIRKLAELHQAGLLTEAEYGAKKAELLQRL